MKRGRPARPHGDAPPPVVPLSPVRRAAAWAVTAAATASAAWTAARLGLPSGEHFAALVVGLAVALLAPGVLAVPPVAFTAAQAVTGVILGTYLSSSTLGVLGASWLPVVAVSLATLALTVAAGLALGRATGVDRATASLGMVAGGASGIVAMAHELGADDRLVAFMQYLRVLVIVLLTPVIVRVAFPGAAAGVGTAAHEAVLGSVRGWALTAGAAGAGTLVAWRVRLPAGSLLGPLLLTAALTLAGVTGDVTVPPPLRAVAFALIGLQVGLRFTPATLRLAGRLLGPTLLTVVGLMAGSLALAWVLSATAGVTLLDAYLATTPGGLYAVLAVALGSHADTTFVLAVQGLRLLVMILAAPLVVRRLARSGAARGAPDRRPGAHRGTRGETARRASARGRRSPAP